MDNYQGAGIYRHYKGSEYLVLGLGLREDTVVKPTDPPLQRPHAGEVTCVVYMPLTPGSMLETRDETFWLRELGSFNEQVVEDGLVDHRSHHRAVPRFQKIRDWDTTVTIGSMY
jgi:hypothetical protein